MRDACPRSQSTKSGRVGAIGLQKKINFGLLFFSMYSGVYMLGNYSLLNSSSLIAHIAGSG